VPRIVVGWHHVRIWYNDYDWYYGRLNIHAGHRHEYVCDDVRYKDSYKHYGFKPTQRGSPDFVAEKYHPDRRKTVFTREAGYVSKSTYETKYAKKSDRRASRTGYKSSKTESSKGSAYSTKGRGVDIGSDSKATKSKRKTSAWDDYNKPKQKPDAQQPSKIGSKKSSGSKGKSSGYSKPGRSGTKKSPGYSSPKSSGSKKSPGYSKPKSSGSKSSSGYSGSKSGSKSSSGSSSKGSSSSSGKRGGKKG